MITQIRYRSLKAYKYLLHEDYICQTALRPDSYLKEPEEHPYIELSPSGMLTVHRGYAWDGPSGPTFDTANFMRGSLVHDALYQLMRVGMLAQEHRAYADDLLRDMCREDGMSKIRSWMVRLAMRTFLARRAAAKQPERSHEILTAP